MDFAFSDQQQRFRQDVREFARAEVTAELFADMERRASEFHPGFHAKLAERGWLGYRVAWLHDQGQTPTAESSMIKVATAELVARIAELGTDILGWSGLVRGGDAPLEGRIEFFLRSIWFHLVGGGTPDIQRNIIAQCKRD